MKVTSTGDLKYLYKLDNYSIDYENSNKLATLWGDMVLEFGRISKDIRITEYFEAQKAVLELENYYVTVMAMVKTLMIITPNSKNPKYAKIASTYVSDLGKLGYRIDVSTSEKYTDSIKSVMQRSKGILTKIRLKKKEASLLLGDNKEDDEVNTYDKAIAWLSASLRFNVPENLTVARYCELRNVINSKKKKG